MGGSCGPGPWSAACGSGRLGQRASSPQQPPRASDRCYLKAGNILQALFPISGTKKSHQLYDILESLNFVQICIKPNRPIRALHAYSAKMNSAAT